MRIEACFGFCGRDVADGFQQASIVEPVDSFEGGELDGLQPSPRASAADHLGLEETDHGLGKRIVVAVAAADRGLDAIYEASLVSSRFLRLSTPSLSIPTDDPEPHDRLIREPQINSESMPLSWLQLLKLWSLRQTRSGSVGTALLRVVSSHRALQKTFTLTRQFALNTTILRIQPAWPSTKCPDEKQANPEDRRW